MSSSVCPNQQAKLKQAALPSQFQTLETQRSRCSVGHFFTFFFLSPPLLYTAFSLRLPPCALRPSSSSSRRRRTYCFSAWQSLGLAKGRRRGTSGGSSGHQIGFKSSTGSRERGSRLDSPPATVEQITDGSSRAGDLLIAFAASVDTHGGRNDHKLFRFVIIKC